MSIWRCPAAAVGHNQDPRHHKPSSTTIAHVNLTLTMHSVDRSARECRFEVWNSWAIIDHGASTAQAPLHDNLFGHEYTDRRKMGLMACCFDLQTSTWK
eukprot:scaffold241016_cov22-Prasinocladus_malaysianus.AAC.1